MEIKSALAELILKYDFRPCTKTEIPLTFKPTFLMQAKHGLVIQITKRKN